MPSPSQEPSLARRLDRRALLSGSAAALGSLGLAGCGEPAPSVAAAAAAPSPNEFAILNRPMVDVHVHVFNTKDLPSYQFIVQSFLAHKPKLLTPSTKMFLRAFVDTVSRYAPGYAQELEIIANNTPPATEPTTAQLINSTFKNIAAGAYGRPADVQDCVIESTATAPDKSGERRVMTGVARRWGVQDPSMVDLVIARIGERLWRPAATGSFLGNALTSLSASTVEQIDVINNSAEWLHGFMQARWQRTNAWASFMHSSPSWPRFAMPAMVDYGFALAQQDRPDTSFDEQVDIMEAISRKQPLENRLVHGYAPFNPWRWVRDPQGTMRLLDKAIKKCGFIGVKLYPPMGFQASGNEGLLLSQFNIGADDSCKATQGFSAAVDQALWTLYKYCADEQVPIMLHSAPSNTAQLTWGARVDPQFWWSILERHPNLRVNFGHFGGAFDLEDDPEAYYYTRTIIALMAERRFPNVYADLADYDLVLKSSDKRQKLLVEFLAKEIAVRDVRNLRQRLMFGTDWEMLARVPGYESYPPKLLRFMQAALGTSGESQLNDFAAGNAVRFIGLDNPRGKVAARLVEFHRRSSTKEREAAMSLLAQFSALGTRQLVASR